MQPQRVRWGVLGTAHIAVSRVIPAMQQSDRCEVLAIASRELPRARAAAAQLGIPCALGSYEELLADPEIEAVYIPLPNHLHVPWSIRAVEAGKHVLCEKPIGLSASEVADLVVARDRAGVLVAEAFMVRTHPQWLAVRELIAEGRIGDLRAVTCEFSYFKTDPDNIRNRADFGGGGLMDIGCYAVNLSRWLFDAEPEEVIADADRDPELGIDRLMSGIMRFGTGHATFTCGTQLVPHQRMQIFGTTGRIEVEIPFNAPPDRAARIVVDDGRDLFGGGAEVIELPAVDQFTLQADRLADAIRGVHPVPVPLEDAIANMAVMDALARSADSRQWERPDAALG